DLHNAATAPPTPSAHKSKGRKNPDHIKQRRTTMKAGVNTEASRRSVLKGLGATAAASVFPASRRALAQKKSIRVLVVADPFYYALNGVAGQFREETGIEASIESLSYDALQARLVSSFVRGQPDADVISVDNIWLGQYLETIKKLNGQKLDGKPMAGSVVAGSQPAPIVHMFTQLSASMGTRWFKHFPEAPWDFEPTIASPENIEAIKLFAEIYKNSPP